MKCNVMLMRTGLIWTDCECVCVESDPLSLVLNSRGSRWNLSLSLSLSLSLCLSLSLSVSLCLPLSLSLSLSPPLSLSLSLSLPPSISLPPSLPPTPPLSLFLFLSLYFRIDVDSQSLNFLQHVNFYIFIV